MRTVLKFYVCLNPLVYPVYPLDTQKTRDFDLRQGRAMARRKSGEALLTQVASCKLSVVTVIHRGFLIFFVGLSGIDPEVDRAAFQPMRHGQSDMSLGFPLLFWYKGFLREELLNFIHLFITNPTKVRQFSIPVGCSKTLPT